MAIIIRQQVAGLNVPAHNAKRVGR